MHISSQLCLRPSRQHANNDSDSSRWRAVLRTITLWARRHGAQLCHVKPCVNIEPVRALAHFLVRCDSTVCTAVRTQLDQQCVRAVRARQNGNCSKWNIAASQPVNRMPDGPRHSWRLLGMHACSCWGARRAKHSNLTAGKQDHNCVRHIPLYAYSDDVMHERMIKMSCATSSGTVAATPSVVVLVAALQLLSGQPLQANNTWCVMTTSPPPTAPYHSGGRAPWRLFNVAGITVSGKRF